MNINYVEVALSIAVSALGIVVILSGASRDAWRRVQGRPTVLEELRDAVDRSAEAATRTAVVAEQDLELRRSERSEQARAEVEIEGWNSTHDPPGAGLILVNHGPGTARRLHGVRALADGKADCAEMSMLPSDERKSLYPWTSCERPEDAPEGEGGYMMLVEWDDPNGERQSTGWQLVKKLH